MNAISEMLTENTGTAAMDSGGAYGRNWQRNQGRDFEAEPARSLGVTWFREGDEFRPDVSINVYHWLQEKTTPAPELDARWQAYAEADREDTAEWSLMQSFMDELADVAGIYGDGEPVQINTYNGECLLSQTLQFIYFEYEGDSYVLLQVHGGCDVRGGYTDAKVFGCDEGILYYADATIYADGDSAFNEDPYWTTDDGYNWYHGGGGPETIKELHSYPVSFNEAHKGDGQHVYVDEDANAAYCPLTGHKLQVAGG